ncbi:MAG: PHP domain-containing protein [Salinivirgaceae bacterium]|nr:PHP domain-containing protein [Salinivirgaceae bacterium]
MNTYQADLHIHTILSPCGDLQMSPKNIIAEAAKKGLDIIGITDHNSTRQSRLIKKLGEKEGIFVLCGAELTSKEEAHCLVFMPDDESLALLQAFLDTNLPNIQNDVNQFGYQVCVDEKENIVFEEPRLLISAINKSIKEIQELTYSLGGIFIPAHVNRPRYSIISQLGFIPDDLLVDALELSRHITRAEFIKQNRYLEKYNFISNSDAHFVNDVGAVNTLLQMEMRSFEELKMALNGLDGRKIIY